MQTASVGHVAAERENPIVRFKATEVFQYYKPSPCERRVSWIAHGFEQEVKDDAFLDLLRRLGERHERQHVQTFPGILDLSPLKDDPDERERQTLAAMREGVSAIYQSRFRHVVLIDGEEVELVGEPDFLIRAAGSGYVIRDSKLARNVLSKRHAGIPAQLQIYGLLYELAAGAPPASLEVHNGAGDIIPVEYRGAAAVLDLVRGQRRLRLTDPGVYEPVGLTKCRGCGYETRCWSEAEAVRDVALLPRVDQDRARDLHARGIPSIAALAAAVDDPDHHDYFWTGKRSPRHKDFVGPLLASVTAHLDNRHVPLEDAPALPAGTSFAMLDLEGLPPYIDDLDRIYLWGLKVRGERPSNYLSARAGFGDDGDRQGWSEFLSLAARLFADYGAELQFVHWSAYEPSKLKTYVDRYGDPEGIAAHVLANSVDLLAALRASVALPLPSYSLKYVDEYVGFRRRLPEANGAWSMAKYIEAIETTDPSARDAMVGEILQYNEEDLDATWAVMEWLRGHPAATTRS